LKYKFLPNLTAYNSRPSELVPVLVGFVLIFKSIYTYSRFFYFVVMFSLWYLYLLTYTGV